jgi:hypothetical protein
MASNLDDLEDHAGVGLVVGGERLDHHPGLGYPRVGVFERHEPRAVRVVAARSLVPVRLHVQVDHQRQFERNFIESGIVHEEFIQRRTSPSPTYRPLCKQMQLGVLVQTGECLQKRATPNS